MFETALAAAKPYLVPVVGGLITTGISWIGAQLSGLIRIKANNAKADRVMASLTHLVNNVVAEMEMAKPTLGTMIQGGKLTAAGKRYLKQAAIKAVQNQLPAPARKIAEGVVNDLPGYIGTKVEAAVLAQKALRPLEAAVGFIGGDD